MKIVKLELGETCRRALEDLQTNGSNQIRERSLAVLHCAAGKKIAWIAEALNRRPLTVRTWINAFEENGISGLKRAYSPGRPSYRRKELQPRLTEYLGHSPRDYGWAEELWTTKTINAQFEKDLGRKFGTRTIERLLQDAGYSYKRARKSMPLSAPSKEEKLARVNEIAKDILNLAVTDDVEVVFLDESHFSSEPYVVRGWYKRGRPFFPSDSQSQGGDVHFWGLRAGEKIFLLEEFEEKQCQSFQGVSPSIANDFPSTKSRGNS